MDKKDMIINNKWPKRRYIAALGLLGFALTYIGASTDDARDAATPAQREHIATPATTFAMEGAGILSLVGAYLLARKRNQMLHRNQKTKQ